jgi:cobalt/nickel transport system ATP-binding protein
LQQLHEAGTTLVFATHDVDLAYGWADQVAVFSDGVVLRQGDAVEVLADKDLLHRAGLRPPLILELARQLGLANGPLRPPRSKDALLALIRRQACQFG